MVSIAAFQAVDPGSIPGRRRSFLCVSKHGKVEKTDFFKDCLKHEQQCFIGFKNTRRSRVFLNPIKHVLRVF